MVNTATQTHTAVRALARDIKATGFDTAFVYIKHGYIRALRSSPPPTGGGYPNAEWDAMLVFREACRDCGLQFHLQYPATYDVDAKPDAPPGLSSTDADSGWPPVAG